MDVKVLQRLNDAMLYSHETFHGYAIAYNDLHKVERGAEVDEQLDGDAEIAMEDTGAHAYSMSRCLDRRRLSAIHLR